MDLAVIERSRPDGPVPRSIRWIALARATRWLGWGFGETLIPVFIAGLTSSLLEAGIISAVYDAVFLISLPVVAWLAESRSSKSLVQADLFLYPFVGLSYYLAGTFGAVGFVVLARVLNGIAYSLDTVGVNVYLRRMARATGIATSFGYTASLANSTWLAAALAGVVLLRFVKIHVLLFLVAPFALVALLPLRRAGRDQPPVVYPASFSSYLGRFPTKIFSVRHNFRSVLILTFLLEFASIASTFFIPIAAYHTGTNLSGVALLCVLSSAPSLSEYWLAKLIEGDGKTENWALTLSVAALPFFFVLAAFAASLLELAMAAFGIGLCAVFGILALQTKATRLSPPASYGETTGLMEGALSLSDLLAPAVLGFVADIFGLGRTFELCAGLYIVIAVIVFQLPFEPVPVVITPGT